MKSSRWYFAANGNGYGPFTYQQLKQLAQTEMIGPSDFVWRQDETEARHVSDVDGHLNDESGFVRANPRIGFGLFIVLLIVGGVLSWTAWDAISDNPAVKAPAKSTLPEPLLSLTFDGEPNPELRLENSGTTFVDGKIGKALKCDGSSFMQVYCELPAENLPRTIAVWLKNTGKPTEFNHHPIAYGSVNPPSLAFGIFYFKNKWGYYGWGHQALTDADVDDNWHHHCLTYDGEEIIYRFDGRIVGKEKGTLATTEGPLVLGTYANLNQVFGFEGLIDEVLVFNTALSTEQVQSLIETQAVHGEDVK
jgi:hypothetical protein